MTMNSRRFAVLTVATCFLMGGTMGFAGDDDGDQAKAKEVKKGRRYVFLPFVYDDEAAKIRQENQKFLAPNP